MVREGEEAPPNPFGNMFGGSNDDPLARVGQGPRWFDYDEPEDETCQGGGMMGMMRGGAMNWTGFGGFGDTSEGGFGGFGDMPEGGFGGGGMGEGGGFGGGMQGKAAKAGKGGFGGGGGMPPPLTLPGSDAVGLECEEGEVLASQPGPNAMYGLAAGQCAEMCSPEFALAFMGGDEARRRCGEQGYDVELGEEEAEVWGMAVKMVMFERQEGREGAEGEVGEEEEEEEELPFWMNMGGSNMDWMPADVSTPVQCDKLVRLMSIALKGPAQQRAQQLRQSLLSPGVPLVKKWVRDWSPQIRSAVLRDPAGPYAKVWKEEKQLLFDSIDRNAQQSLVDYATPPSPQTMMWG